MADEAAQTAETWVPNPKTDTFGDRIRLLRYDLGLTVEEVSTLCSLPAHSWWNWENGRKPRDLVDVVNKIADGTNVNRTWLMFGSTSAR